MYVSLLRRISIHSYSYQLHLISFSAFSHYYHVLLFAFMIKIPKQSFKIPIRTPCNIFTHNQVLLSNDSTFLWPTVHLKLQFLMLD